VIEPSKQAFPICGVVHRCFQVIERLRLDFGDGRAQLQMFNWCGMVGYEERRRNDRIIQQYERRQPKKRIELPSNFEDATVDGTCDISICVGGLKSTVRRNSTGAKTEDFRTKD